MDPTDVQIKFVLAGQRVRALFESRLSEISDRGARLTYHRYLVLDYICRNQRCSRRDISYGLGIPEATLTGVPDYLLKHGLVEEEFISYERVQRRLSVSEAGVEVVSEARTVMAKAAEEIAKEIAAEGMATVSKAAEHVLSVLPLPERFQAKPYSRPVRRRRLAVRKT